MTKTVKISVIVPVYNAQSYLAECLDSALKQSMHDIEILCIDDGSDDRSLAILEEYKNRDQRVRVFKQDNKGSGPARNLGIRHAEGKYVSFLDADDRYPNIHVLETLYTKAVKNEALICGGSMTVFGKTNLINRNESRFDKEGWIDFSSFQWDYEFYRYLFSREFLINNELLFPDLRRYQDPPFLLKAMIAAKSFYAIKEETYSFREKGTDFSNWNFEKANDLAKGILKCMEIAFDNGLMIAFENNLSRVNDDFRYLFVKQLKDNNVELEFILNNINKLSIDSGIKEEGYMIDPLRISKEEKKSYFVIKRGMFRNIRNSIKENGLKYTVDRILFHLHLKEDNDEGRTISKL